MVEKLPSLRRPTEHPESGRSLCYSVHRAASFATNSFYEHSTLLVTRIWHAVERRGDRSVLKCPQQKRA